MATYIFQFFLSQFGYLEMSFYRMYIEMSSTFVRHLSKLLKLIGCQGDKSVYFSKEMLKNLILRNHKLNEAETWHTRL